VKCTITDLAASIGDQAAEIGLAAVDLDNLFAVEVVVILRDAQRLLNRAKDTLVNAAAAGRAEDREDTACSR
jgi:hypothetical protein